LEHTGGVEGSEEGGLTATWSINLKKEKERKVVI
jgi:hypothetical protein